MADSEKPKTILPPSMQKEDGTLDAKALLKKIFAKGTTPTVLAGIVAALVNAYTEYQDLRRTVASREQTLTALQSSVNELKEELNTERETRREGFSATRDRFESNERAALRLRGTVGSLQTEVRVRHGVATYIPPALESDGSEEEEGQPRRRLRRSEQIEAVAAEVDESYVNAGRAMPQGDPLAGLDL